MLEEYYFIAPNELRAITLRNELTQAGYSNIQINAPTEDTPHWAIMADVVPQQNVEELRAIAGRHHGIFAGWYSGQVSYASTRKEDMEKQESVLRQHTRGPLWNEAWPMAGRGRDRTLPIMRGPSEPSGVMRPKEYEEILDSPLCALATLPGLISGHIERSFDEIVDHASQLELDYAHMLNETDSEHDTPMWSFNDPELEFCAGQLCALHWLLGEDQDWGDDWDDDWGEM